MAKLNSNFFKKLPAHEKKLTLSNQVTLLRIILVPFIVAAMVLNHWHTSFVLFVIAALTDTIDGTLARLRNEKTFLGACLDPLADKILLVSIFTTLAFVHTPLNIPWWFVMMVLCRETVIIAGAFVIFVIKGHLQISPTKLGKSTTTAQLCTIAWLFVCHFFNWVPVKTYHLVLLLLVAMESVSLFQYIKIGLKQLRSGKIA